jgi:cell division protein FtsI (penicillin-binding protein 3)
MSDGRATVWIRARMMIVALLVLGLLAGVVHRAYRLQVTEGARLREMAEQQYLKEMDLPPRRGTIYDRHGTPLAVSVDVDSVYANPRVVGERAAEAARGLSEVLGLDTWSLQRQLSSRRYFTWIKRRISPAEAKRVRELGIRGVYLTPESRRFYPNHGLGGSVVGFAGLDARGLEGVELAYDEWLRGSSVRVAGLRDALGRYVHSEGAQPVTSATHDLQLTLDKLIQFETEQAIGDAYREVHPKSGWVAAVVMEPRTGDILAMASVPSFDPNHYAEAKPWQWRNRAVTDAFEPGSTMKVFTVAAALEQGLVQPGDVFDCEKGRWRIGHYTIHDSHPNDELDVVGTLKKSSNICAAKIGFRVGKSGLHRALRRFGFGRQTGVELPGERAGVLRSPKRWSDVALANISFGQGLTTTALHLARGMSAIANGGVLMRPRLVSGIRNDRGEVVKSFPPEGTRLLPHGVADRLLSMLTAVTERGGTGVDAALERFTVAGKTGTAQKVDPVTGTYATDRWVSSFMGAVPATKPRLVIVAVVNEPSGDKHYGGEVAGPVFKRIAEKALPYLGVKADRPADRPERQRRSEDVPIASEGYVDEEHAPPLPGESGEGGEVLVPDFTGMSIGEVLNAVRHADLRLELEGSGRAVAQSPGPGPAARQTVCRVSFRPPG